MAIFDVKLFYFTADGTLPGTGRLRVENSDLIADNTIATAIVNSLFIDKRYNNEQGFWGDVLLGRSIGSLLWTLERVTINDTTIALIKQYSIDALQWLLDQKMVSSIDVSVYRQSTNRINLEIHYTE
jgi:phage gp46-like protein